MYTYTYVHTYIPKHMHRSDVIYSNSMLVYTPIYATVIKVPRTVMLILCLYHLNEHMS